MTREMRTTAQIEANRLDLEIFNLATRMERFAAEWASGNDGLEIADNARRVFATRSSVRRFMHRRDRDETVKP